MELCEECNLPKTYLLHAEHAIPDSLTPAQLIALAIYNDVTSRRGIKNAFWSCDDDIIQEVLECWVGIIGSNSLASPAPAVAE